MGRSLFFGSLVAALLASAAFVAPAGAEDAPQAQSLAGAFLAAQVAESDNDLSSAISYYKQALGFDPDNTALKQSLLVSLLSDGRFKEAMPLAESLKKTPEIERFARVALAVDAFKNKQYRTAQTLLKLALQSDLDRLITGSMSAWALEGSGKPQDALAALAKLKGPLWFDLFRSYNAALIADVAGMKDEADKSYKAALDDTEGGGASPETYERVVAAYASFKARDHDLPGALDVLDTGEKLLPNRPPFNALRKQIKGGETPAALVSSAQQGAAEVLYSLGTAVNRSGTEIFAKLYLQLALALRPDSASTLLQLGDISEKLKDPQAAVQYYRQVPKNSPYESIAEMRLSVVLTDLHQEPEAIDRMKALIKDDPKDMRAYLILGGIYSQKKDYAGAAANYDQAVSELASPSREDWSIFYQRGIAYERLKQWDKAEPNFKKALDLYPNQPQVLNYLGYSWVDMNMHLDQALDMIRKAVELSPQDGYIVDSLGWAYFKLGRYDQAVSELEKAIQLQPEDATINDHLGDAYWRAGRKLDATFQWSHARDMKPDAEELAKINEKLQHGLPPLPAPAVAKDSKPSQAEPAPAAPSLPGTSKT